MENKKRIEILKRLKDGCQIPPEELKEQLEIINKQNDEIIKYREISIQNLQSLQGYL